MAEEFQTGICSGNWWNSPRNSLCSTGMSDIGSFGWATEAADVKPARSCDQESNISVVSHDSSIVFQDVRKPQMADSAAGSGGVLINSTLQMMNFGLSTPTTDWNQTLLRGGGRADESNFSSMLEEDMNSRLNYRQETGIDSSQIQKDWSPKSFSGGSENSSIDAFKQMNQDFNPINGSGDCTATCQGFSTGFPIGSGSYGYPSNFIQSLFESDPQPQQSLCNNVNQSANNYCSVGNYGTSSNEILPSNWPKFSPFLRPTLPKQQPSSLHFSNNTPFWNASAAALSDIRSRFFPSSGSQFHASTFEEKPTCTNQSSKANIEEVRDSLKKSSSEPAFKRPRIETPSPLPTFKVRKEKLGDRITALQQLVSPFGKTDTASVLHEAIEYIKFLHDQVSVLSTPYMKNGSGAPIQQQQASDKLKSPEGSKPDLKSRGLCLVPISSTFPVANESTADFWTPTFGGTFR